MKQKSKLRRTKKNVKCLEIDVLIAVCIYLKIAMALEIRQMLLKLNYQKNVINICTNY